MTKRRLNVRHRLLYASSWVIVLILAVLQFGQSLRADLIGPNAEDRAITREVVRLLDIHLSKHPLDDEISRRCLELFLERFDSRKVYFLQSDVDRFKTFEADIDDMVKERDVSFAYEVANTFLQRLDERMVTIRDLLQQKFDFTVDEELLIDPDLDTYPQNAEEAREKWRKRIKLSLLIEKADGIEDAEAREKLTRRYESFAKRMHQLDNQELREIFLSSLARAYDPHTTYMSADTVDSFDINMSLGLEGIGAQLSSEDGYTVVTKVIRGGAADKHAKLQVGDKIVGVGQGEDGEIEDVVDMKLTQVVKLIRGKPNTVVRLEVIPEGGKERKTYAITRAKIELKEQEAHGKVFEFGSSPEGVPYRIGVIDLPSFYMDFEGARRNRPDYKSTTRDVERILGEFKQQEVDAVVVDLRGNGGGSLPESIRFTGLFIDEGPVLQVKDVQGQIVELPDTDRGMAWDGPLVVLINKFSASASEIFAGAIKDYGRGIVVGDQATHGKGTVQQMVSVGESIFGNLFGAKKFGAVKLTINQFYRPDGESTQKHGVRSDIEWPSITTHFPVGEGDFDYAFEWNKIDPASHARMNLIDAAMLDRLKDSSAQRISDSEDFQKVLERIERYKEQKEQKTFTLNEEKFLAERAEVNAEEEEEDYIEKLELEDGDEIVRDFYLDEALAIAADYARLTQEKQVAQLN